MLNIFYDWITSQQIAVCKCRFVREFVDTAHLHVDGQLDRLGRISLSPQRQCAVSCGDRLTGGRASRVTARLGVTRLN